VINNKETDVSLERHTWEQSGEIVVYYSRSFISECTKTEYVAVCAVLLVGNVVRPVIKCVVIDKWGINVFRCAVV
jgi:hypothetical protein